MTRTNQPYQSHPGAQVYMDQRESRQNRRGSRVEPPHTGS